MLSGVCLLLTPGSSWTCSSTATSSSAACSVKCGKPFGTLRAIENMLSKLAGHSAFQGAAAERLKMCSDCRVVDMFSASNEVRITDL